MEKMNQNYIVEALKNQGVNPDEIQTRLMKWKMSTSGQYNPLTDTYKDQVENEPTEALKVPETTNKDVSQVIQAEQIGEAAADPSNLPPLRSQEDIDKEFLKPFELDPTIEDEPIQ